MKAINNAGQNQKGVSRRGFFRTAGAGAAAAASVGLTTQTVSADVSEMNAAIMKATGGAKAQSGRVKMKTPIIAENGGVVPVIVSVDSPMTDADHVKSVSLFIQENPNPEVATFNFSPACGEAEVKVNCRMAKTSKIVAVAMMSDGSVFQADKTIKVTIGGCGG